MRALTLLQRSLTHALETVHARRLCSLWGAVESLTLGGKLTLSELGRSSRSPSDVKHRTKRICRLLGNPHLHGETMTVYRGVANFLLGKTRRVLLLVDWTPVGNKRRHHALVAATPIGGRAVTLYEEVHPENLCGARKVEKQFLARLKAILPADCVPVIVTDAGFRTPWFDAVDALGWNFVGRVRQPTKAKMPSRSDWMPTKSLFKKAKRQPTDLGQMSLTRSKPRLRRLVILKPRPGAKRAKPYKCWRGSAKKTGAKRTKPRPTARHRLSAQEPWLLATSLNNLSAQGVVAIYKTRMQIEETFRDLKSHRFGWSFDDSRSNTPKRIEILLLIAALACLCLLLIGLAAEASNLQRRFQVNTIRNRRVFSLTTLAQMLLAQNVHRFSASELIGASEHLRALVLAGYAGQDA